MISAWDVVYVLCLKDLVLLIPLLFCCFSPSSSSLFILSYSFSFFSPLALATKLFYIRFISFPPFLLLPSPSPLRLAYFIFSFDSFLLLSSLSYLILLSFLPLTYILIPMFLFSISFYSSISHLLARFFLPSSLLSQPPPLQL